MAGEQINFDETGVQPVEGRIDFDETDIKPVRDVGFIESALRTVKESARTALQHFDVVKAGLDKAMRGGDAPIYVQARTSQAAKPDERFSTPGVIAGGLASIPFEIGGGFGTQHGTERGLQLLERGATPGEAQTGAAVSGGIHAALNALPIKLGGTVGKAIEGKVGSVLAGGTTGGVIAGAGGAAGRAIEDATLPEGTQFEDLKQPNDLNTIALDAAMGAVFGGGSGAVAARTARKKTKAAAEAKAAEFPVDKFEDLGEGNYRAPNGSTVTKEAWESASKRVRDGWMEEAPKEPKEPKLQEEIDRLREEHPSGPVANVVNEITRQREKTAKTKADAAELRRAAELTTDVELKKALNKRADKLDPPEKIPVGEVREGQPKIEGEAPKTIPVGEVREGQPEIKTEKPEPIPKGEVIEEKIPVGETDEIPGTGGKIPVGEAKEITRSGVEPTDEPKPGSIPKGEVRELYIPPEKRNAADQVVKQESLQQKRVEGNEGGQAAEAGSGDRVQRAAQGAGPEAVAPRDWGNTATEAAQKIRDLKAKGEISALDEAKMLSLADKHKSDPNLRTTKLNNFLADRGKPIAPRTTKATKGVEPEAPEVAGKPMPYGAADDFSFDPNKPETLTFPKIEASMIDAAQRETERKGVYRSTPRADDGLRVVGKDDRGTVQARTALREGIRDGTVHKDGGELALWALEQNPNLARGLKVKTSGEKGPGRGLYDHAVRTIELFKDNNRTTAAHEILHHSERMMPEIVQTGIRREWKRALSKAVASAKTPAEKQGLKDMMASAFRGDRNARVRAMDAMREGIIDQHKFYHLLNPSEFWAVNAANILHERHVARGSWRGQAKRWLKELVEKAKGLVGVRSDAPLLKALDKVLNPKKVRGERSGAKMLSEGGGRTPREVPRDFQDPNDDPGKFRKSIGDRVRTHLEYGAMLGRRHDWAYNVGDHMLSTKTGKTYELTGRTFQPVGKIKDNNWQAVYSYKGSDGSQGTFIESRMKESTTLKNLTTPTMLAPNAPKAPKRKLEDETKFEKVERGLFDRFNRVAKLQKTEAPKKEGADIYLGDQLFQGRAQHRGDVLQRDFIEPLGKDLEAAKKLDLTVADADDYLMALHAPERNAAIAQINPKMPDGGSGLTNAQAKKIVDSFSPEQRKALDAIAKRVHDMHRKKLNDMVDDGLITADLRDALNRKFKKYVPLKTLDEEEAFTGIGQGYSMRATDVKEALGRSSKAGSPIAASMMDAARSIVRGEKARVDKTIWEYSQDKDAHDFIKPYDPNKPPPEVMKQAKGPDGQVKKVVDPNKVRDMTIDLVIDGKQQKVFVPDQLLRDQIRKLATVNDPGKILGAVGKMTGGIGRMLTEFNPAFTLPNAVRDSITIGMRAKAHGLSPAKVVGGIPEAWGQIVNYKRGANTPGAKAYEEFLTAGGKTGAYGMTDVTHTLRRLERLGAQLGYKEHETGLLRRKGGKALRTAARAMSGFNEIFEYAGRFSAYQQARAAGKSVKESAAIAKEISVNFNRSGEYSRALNSVLVFANAALQGLRNSAVYAKSPAVRMAMLGTVGVGAAAQAWNELMGGVNEDTGEPKANMQNDAIADKNLTLMWPGSDKGIKVPLPPEYSWLYTMGRRGYRAFSQGHWKKDAAGIAGSMLDALLPVRLPGTDSHVGAAAKAVVFTPVVPFADLLGDNKNFFGQDIVPDRHDDISPAPYAKTSRTTTSDIAKGISEGLNTLTGGDNIRPGGSEKLLGPLVSPEGIEHITGFYTGGLGQLAMQSKNLAKAATKGDAVDINKVPIINRFVFEEPKSYTSRRYKELRPEFEYALDYRKAGQPEKADPKAQRALSQFVGAEKELRVLFKRFKSAASSGNDAERKEIETQIKRAQSRVLRAYYGQPMQ